MTNSKNRKTMLEQYRLFCLYFRNSFEYCHAIVPKHPVFMFS